MAKHDCEVCCGRGTVRLALHKRVSALRVDYGAAESIDMASREYPCPECGIKANVERVFAVDAHVMVDDRTPAEAMPHVKRGAVHKLAGMMFDKGFIEFEKGPARWDGHTFPLVATLYAVHPGEARRSIEDRIRERQQLLATVAADEAIRQIDNWGSYPGTVGALAISKDVAARLIREAVMTANRNWSKVQELTIRDEIVD